MQSTVEEHELGPAVSAERRAKLRPVHCPLRANEVSLQRELHWFSPEELVVLQDTGRTLPPREKLFAASVDVPCAKSTERFYWSEEPGTPASQSGWWKLLEEEYAEEEYSAQFMQRGRQAL